MEQYKPDMEEINDEYLEAMLRIAFRLQEEAQIRALVEKSRWDPTEEEKAQAREEWQRIVEKYEKMREEEAKREHSASLRRNAKRVFRMAACVLLILAIAAPVAIASVETLRVSVMKLLIDIQEDHTELRLVESGEPGIEIPEGWTGLYYPAYMPEGFELEEISKLYCSVKYCDELGNVFYFSEYDKATSVNINSENAHISYSEIHGEEVLIVEKEGHIILTWQCGSRFLVIETDISKEEVLKIAGSVHMIQ